MFNCTVYKNSKLYLQWPANVEASNKKNCSLITLKDFMRHFAVYIINGKLSVTCNCVLYVLTDQDNMLQNSLCEITHVALCNI